MMVFDTDSGENISKMIDDLKTLLSMYRTGEIKPNE